MSILKIFNASFSNGFENFVFFSANNKRIILSETIIPLASLLSYIEIKTWINYYIKEINQISPADFFF